MLKETRLVLVNYWIFRIYISVLIKKCPIIESFKFDDTINDTILPEVFESDNIISNATTHVFEYIENEHELLQTISFG